MTKNEKYSFLKINGWYQWYNDDYWCSEKRADFLKKGDYRPDSTDVGLSTDLAVEFEQKLKTLQSINNFNSDLKELIKT